MKKNKKKGFTLVELLAVIVVLAIILVIAVPKILDVIKNTRLNSLISSVKLIARNAEQKLLTNEVLGVSTNTLSCDEVADINTTDYKSCNIDINDGIATVTIEGQGKFSGYTCSGTKNNVTCTKGEEIACEFGTREVYSLKSNINVEECMHTLVSDVLTYNCSLYPENSMCEDIATSVDPMIGIYSEAVGPFCSKSSPYPESYEGEHSIKNYIDFYLRSFFGAGIDDAEEIMPNYMNSYVNVKTECIGNDWDTNALTVEEALDMGLVWYDIDDDSVGIGLGFNETPSLHTNFTTLDIPSSIGGKKVTTIGYYAFKECIDLTSVTIPSSVTSIGYGAFYECTSLTNITIPNSVTSIGYRAFDETPWLESLEYDDNGLLIINNKLYDVDENVISVTLPSSVTSIGDYAFEDCTRLTSVIIPNSVTNIGEYAFAWCESLASITIPNSVISIGIAAFYDTPWFENQYNEDGLLIINNILYDADKNVTNVTIPSSVRSIGDAAFEECYNLTSVTIPNSVISIGTSAFEYCGLESVIIPNSVTSIGERAFAGCLDLENIIISSSVTSIGNYAFEGTSWIVNQYNENGLIIINNILYDVDDSATNVIVPNGVTGILSNAFEHCTNLTSVTIPTSVTTIENGSFYGFDSLISVTIPNSVTSIGMNAFRDCDNLTSITIPNSVEVMGDGAFEECYNLENVVFEGNNFMTLNNAFNYTKWFDDNANEDGYILDDNYLVRLVDSNCFLAGTKVLTIDGYKNIEDIDNNDMVLSYNVKTGVNEYKKVRRLFVHKDVNDELYELTINNEVLKVTASHKFYVKTNDGYDWIAVKDMNIGEKIIDENGNLNIITDIKYNNYHGTLYNLSVEDNHNYYVTDHNYLVHNAMK